MTCNLDTPLWWNNLFTAGLLEGVTFINPSLKSVWAICCRKLAATIFYSTGRVSCVDGQTTARCRTYFSNGYFYIQYLWKTTYFWETERQSLLQMDNLISYCVSHLCSMFYSSMQCSDHSLVLCCAAVPLRWIVTCSLCANTSMPIIRRMTQFMASTGCTSYLQVG